MEGESGPLPNISSSLPPVQIYEETLAKAGEEFGPSSNQVWLLLLRLRLHLHLHLHLHLLLLLLLLLILPILLFLILNLLLHIHLLCHHQHPSSPQTIRKLEELDQAMIHLEQRLNATQTTKLFNIVILSDHGQSLLSHNSSTLFLQFYTLYFVLYFL